MGAGADAHGAKHHLDSAFKIEQLCSSCGVRDVTRLALDVDGSSASAMLDVKAAAKLFLECLDGLCCSAGAQVGSERACGDDGRSLLGPLHSHVTIVCIADSIKVPELLRLDCSALREAKECGRQREALRLVVFMVSSLEPRAKQRSGICAQAMLRAAGALSLVDGPCGLTCGGFFAEMAEQVHEIADGCSKFTIASDRAPCVPDLRHSGPRPVADCGRAAEPGP
eukprot:CAMPEP_0117615736 /NCGR_PEP_ID=MMETSP0784-20121206/84690_1 /TAXON_ID=39447 /ORGANISM="" /LENGTH=224 /DNA_ID=CAMNT_0005419475 /DNA_START=1 /DNA_END=672 /DNA_ORIENTATION=+